MKHLTEKNIVLVLIAVCLGFLLFGNSATNSETTAEDAAAPAAAFVDFPQTRSFEKVVYLCRLGDEEIPGVQIAEVADESGRVTGVVARVIAGAGIEVAAPDAVPVWDYKAISARSAGSLIEVAYSPEQKRAGYDWVLTLRDVNTVYTERVRDCMEVSDE